MKRIKTYGIISLAWMFVLYLMGCFIAGSGSPSEWATGGKVFACVLWIAGCIFEVAVIEEEFDMDDPDEQ